MAMERMFKLGVITLLTVVLSACGTSDTSNTEAMDNTPAVNTAPSNNSSSATPTGAGNNVSNGLTAREIDTRDRALAMTVFYFEFDSSNLDVASRQALSFHATRLKANPGMKVRLEGHADERGTREYNIALGERRAQAIERFLLVQGVGSNQMETISYGEEVPAVAGSSQASYARNRRVEIK